MSRIRGLELLHSLVKDKLQSKQDCAVMAIHCLLINEQLQCVGIGEEFSDSDTGTELLPKDWNNNQEVYTLRYISKDKKNKFLMKIVKAGQILHANIVLNEELAGAMSVNLDKHIADDYGDFSSAYLDLECLIAAFRRDILEKLIEPKTEGAAATASGSNQPPQPANPLQVEPQRNPRPRPDHDPNYDFDPAEYPFPGFLDPDRNPFPNIGGRDLDPLGRGPGGGMLMDPFYRPRPSPYANGPFDVPRPPPGARFDPFGPPVPGPNRGRPNPDHFRRPNDFDDDGFL